MLQTRIHTIKLDTYPFDQRTEGLIQSLFKVLKPDHLKYKLSGIVLNPLARTWILLACLLVLSGGKNDLLGTSNAYSQENTETPTKGSKSAKNKLSTKHPVVDVSERLSFDQSNVTAQMGELEERMFRLAEALRSLEAENASRLMLGLKTAREELIQLQMKRVADLLKKDQLNDASTEQKHVLAKLKKLRDLLLSTNLDFQLQLARLRKLREALQGLSKVIKEEEREMTLSKDLAEQQKNDSKISPDLFATLQQDQADNRKATDQISEIVRQAGSAAVTEMIRASGSMSSAGSKLGKQAAKQAHIDQKQAVDSLKYAQRQLETEANELLGKLQSVIRRMVMEALESMREMQVQVRETTMALAPKIEKGSRVARINVVGLGKSEQAIIDIADEIVTLIEETEFAVALPAALRIVRESMMDVQQSLSRGDASKPVVVSQRRIEADLAALLDAMKDMPSTRLPKDPSKRCKSCNRKKELNLLKSEMKMIRILQVRVNDDTLAADRKRPEKETSLAPELLNAIKGIEKQEAKIQQATTKIAAASSCVKRPIIDIAQDMGTIVRDLSKSITGEPAQSKQKGVVKKIDELLELLDRECKACKSGGGNQNPSKPLADSVVVKGPGGMGELHAPSDKEKKWGELRPQERDRITQSLTEGFPPHYKRLLEQYYRRLAEQTPLDESAND